MEELLKESLRDPSQAVQRVTNIGGHFSFSLSAVFLFVDPKLMARNLFGHGTRIHVPDQEREQEFGGDLAFFAFTWIGLDRMPRRHVQSGNLSLISLSGCWEKNMFSYLSRSSLLTIVLCLGVDGTGMGQCHKAWGKPWRTLQSIWWPILFLLFHNKNNFCLFELFRLCIFGLNGLGPWRCKKIPSGDQPGTRKFGCLASSREISSTPIDVKDLGTIVWVR